MISMRENVNIVLNPYVSNKSTKDNRRRKSNLENKLHLAEKSSSTFGSDHCH